MNKKEIKVGDNLVSIESIKSATQKENYMGEHPIDRYYDPEYWHQLRERFDVPGFALTDTIDVEFWLEKARREGWLKKVLLSPRGTDAALPGGGLPEGFSPYLNMLIFLTGGPPGPIGLQFVVNPNIDRMMAGHEDYPEYVGFLDSLEEDKHAVAWDLVPDEHDPAKIHEVPALIHKYEDRVLLLVTKKCAAYCGYCTRGRYVGFGHSTSSEAIDRAFEYIAQHPEIHEIIMSGGDPMTAKDEAFVYIIDKIKALIAAGHPLNSVRVGTRSIIHNAITPGLNGKGDLRNVVISNKKMEALASLPLKVHMMLHINHPWELTTQVLKWLEILDKGAHVDFYSQSVLLAGVNNNREVLRTLFDKIQGSGIEPYYVYLCDLVEWGLNFLVSIPEARELFDGIKDEIGGLKIPSPVIDVADGGVGKIGLFSEYIISGRMFEDYKRQLFVVYKSWHEKYDPIKHGVPTKEELLELERRGRPIAMEQVIQWVKERFAVRQMQLEENLNGGDEAQES